MADINFKNLRVLIIDDDEFIRLMLKKHLNKFGVTSIFEADNGMDGTIIFEEQLNKNPDLIICDINMEPLNGFEFLTCVRASAKSGKRVPIIFLTGDVSPEYLKQAVDLTADAYLLKPVTPDVLKEKIISLLAPGKKS